MVLICTNFKVLVISSALTSSPLSSSNIFYFIIHSVLPIASSCAYTVNKGRIRQDGLALFLNSSPSSEKKIEIIRLGQDIFKFMTVSSG